MSSGKKNAVKSTSLQAWGKLTEQYFHKKLRVEDRKDRQRIYELLKEIGLPYERFHAFSTASEITNENFLEAVGDLGLPYWISATPKVGIEGFNRLSKLGIGTADDGWSFIQTLPDLKAYKVIVMEYPTDIEFKGSVVVSQQLNGIADFVLGDKHLELISGLTISDPMLFNSQKIIHYSETIDKNYQDMLYSYVSSHPGHFEFQYGISQKEKGLSFFDYNDEPAYEDIDGLFHDLLVYHDLNIQQSTSSIITGLPASHGRAKGICKVIMSSESERYNELKEGEILVTDSTNPDMTQAMKNAAAIVTDFGGVTCHAAIVCREMEIPCIVGTRQGTTALKDNMKVEVDAFKGTVTIES